MHRIAADWRVDTLALLNQTPDKRDVLLVDFAIMELARQFLVRGIIFRDHHEAGRPFVKTMDDAGPTLAADATQVAEMMK
jgi:hypothetical protein